MLLFHQDFICSLPSVFFPFFSFVPIFPVRLLVCPMPFGWGLGRTFLPPLQQVEGCLILQNSMAFWEWDNASPPPNKPPKKSASASCLVCEGAASVVDSLSQTPPPPPPPHTLHTFKVSHCSKGQTILRAFLCNSTLVFPLSYTYLKGTVHPQF